MIRLYRPQIKQCTVCGCACHEFEGNRTILRILEIESVYTGSYAAPVQENLWNETGLHDTIFEPVYPTVTMYNGGFRLKMNEKKI